MSREHGIPNDAWNGYNPNTYPPQHQPAQYGNNFVMPQPNGVLQQYQIRGNMQHGQAGYWDPNAQMQYDMSPANYAPNNFYTPPPVQPQYYQPQNPQMAQHHYSIDPRVAQQHMAAPSNPPINQNYSQMSPAKPAAPPLDYPLLVISLAEEYFAAAHELAPSVVVSMTAENVHEYHKLITMGLECLSICLKQLKLPPRLEARVRLRFAGVICEETNNYTEAETLLSQGIILCERNHYQDLKYAMQFQLARLMFERNPKASMKILDGQIADAFACQHFSWVYALRFLRASHALEVGTSTDSNAAIQNIRSISSLAHQHNDRSIYIVASLMEAVAHLKSGGVEALEQVQRAIAAARTYQLDNGSSMPQLVGLTHILDVACSILAGNPTQMKNTCKAMQVVMDDLLNQPGWSTELDTLRIPIDSVPKVRNLISQDTRMVLGIREDGRDEMVMSFLNKRDAYSITLVQFHTPLSTWY
ncbi:cohesin loading factor protein [Rutstroemia sp. NJR-2017a WRK4]|nr:cohesin loading factor protein [Rutstroemia sp. NJR-2017a WRK4]